jgi:hypothetical protein
VAATSTGVITLCRVGSSRVARAAEWSRVPWGGESRGSGGEDEPCSVIRFNYNLLWICLNHSIAAVFYAANSNYSFSWNCCSGGKRTACWLQPSVITGITLRWPRSLPAKIVKRAAVSFRVPRILLCRLCGFKSRV